MPDIISLLVAALLVGGYFFYREIYKKRSRPPKNLSFALHALNAKIEAYAQKTHHARELCGSPDFREAVALLGKADLDVIRQYTAGDNVHIAAAAFEALAGHPERQKTFDAIIVRINQLDAEALHFALRYFASLPERPPVGGPAVVAQPWWANSGALVESYKDYFIQREKLGDAAECSTAWLDWSLASPPLPIQNFLSRIDHPTAKRLQEEVRQWSLTRLDRKFLTAFGRFWDARVIDLSAPPPWTPLLDLAEKSILSAPPRSILVSGEPRIGKTSFIRLLGDRLLEQGWQIFEASAADLMAGQTYFGELEGRVRRTVEELQSSKRAAWYVTDILQLAESGTHRGQSASILDQILPAVLAGRLVIIAEASPESMNRLFQMRPSLRTQMEVHKLQPFTASELAALAQDVARIQAFRAGILLEDDAVSAALQLSQQYMGSGNLPGMVVDLIKRAVQHAAAGEESQVTPHSMLTALSQITGLPAAILDDKARVDLAAMRRFFSERVIGQDEAVSAITDRIAMLKAGLADPGRPVGVFLFAGPTGTGKTELAKALAAYLFGSPARMTRLDMSEFQSADSISKILGERGYASAADPLVERVRKQPFCVILLDEFEKAHPNVWDLFLQIFDDGRLADANGRVADFRHTIIILTSNLGATDHRGGDIGFLRTKDSYGESQVLQAVARAFRPEFVNRLDKIVVFKPLSRPLMREILHKELRLVLERRGLRNREWVVEWEQSAIEFLLDKGFSPDMGARPLKRAIDQYLLAPLAATLVEHRFPEGDQFLFVRSNGDAIEVEFVDPDAELPPPEAEAAVKAPPTGTSLAMMILQPRGTDAERAALDGYFSQTDARLASPEWNEAKQEALDKANAADIWNDPARHAVFARVTLFDRVGEAMRTAQRLKQRLASGRSRELIGRLALQLHLVDDGIEDAMTDAPIDAVIAIEPVLEAGTEPGASAQWCERLEQMYRRWAQRRHMQTGDTGRPGLILVGGFGAFRTLQDEAGLHVLEEDGRRMTAQITIAPGPREEPRPGQTERACAQAAAGAEKSLAIVRRYREKPAPLVRDAKAGWRSGRLDQVLDGDFDLIGVASGED